MFIKFSSIFIMLITTFSILLVFKQQSFAESIIEHDDPIDKSAEVMQRYGEAPPIEASLQEQYHQACRSDEIENLICATKFATTLATINAGNLRLPAKILTQKIFHVVAIAGIDVELAMYDIAQQRLRDLEIAYGNMDICTNTQDENGSTDDESPIQESWYTKLRNSKFASNLGIEKKEEDSEEDKHYKKYKLFKDMYIVLEKIALKKAELYERLSWMYQVIKIAGLYELSVQLNIEEQAKLHDLNETEIPNSFKYIIMDEKIPLPPLRKLHGLTDVLFNHRLHEQTQTGKVSSTFRKFEDLPEEKQEMFFTALELVKMSDAASTISEKLSQFNATRAGMIKTNISDFQIVIDNQPEGMEAKHKSFFDQIASELESLLSNRFINESCVKSIRILSRLCMSKDPDYYLNIELEDLPKFDNLGLTKDLESIESNTNQMLRGNFEFLKQEEEQSVSEEAGNSPDTRDKKTEEKLSERELIRTKISVYRKNSATLLAEINSKLEAISAPFTITFDEYQYISNFADPKTLIKLSKKEGPLKAKSLNGASTTLNKCEAQECVKHIAKVEEDEKLSRETGKPYEPTEEESAKTQHCKEVLALMGNKSRNFKDDLKNLECKTVEAAWGALPKEQKISIISKFAKVCPSLKEQFGPQALCMSAETKHCDSISDSKMKQTCQESVHMPCTEPVPNQYQLESDAIFNKVASETVNEKSLGGDSYFNLKRKAYIQFAEEISIRQLKANSEASLVDLYANEDKKDLYANKDKNDEFSIDDILPQKDLERKLDPESKKILSEFDRCSVQASTLNGCGNQMKKLDECLDTFSEDAPIKIGESIARVNAEANFVSLVKDPLAKDRVRAEVERVYKQCASKRIKTLDKNEKHHAKNLNAEVKNCILEANMAAYDAATDEIIKERLPHLTYSERANLAKTKFACKANKTLSLNKAGSFSDDDYENLSKVDTDQFAKGLTECGNNFKSETVLQIVESGMIPKIRRNLAEMSKACDNINNQIAKDKCLDEVSKRPEIIAAASKVVDQTMDVMSNCKAKIKMSASEVLDKKLINCISQGMGDLGSQMTRHSLNATENEKEFKELGVTLNAKDKKRFQEMTSSCFENSIKKAQQLEDLENAISKATDSCAFATKKEATPVYFEAAMNKVLEKQLPNLSIAERKALASELSTTLKRESKSARNEENLNAMTYKAKLNATKEISNRAIEYQLVKDVSPFEITKLQATSLSCYGDIQIPQSISVEQGKAIDGEVDTCLKNTTSLVIMQKLAITLRQKLQSAIPSLVREQVGTNDYNSKYGPKIVTPILNGLTKVDKIKEIFATPKGKNAIKIIIAELDAGKDPDTFANNKIIIDAIIDTFVASTQVDSFIDHLVYAIIQPILLDSKTRPNLKNSTVVSAIESVPILGWGVTAVRAVIDTVIINPLYSLAANIAANVKSVNTLDYDLIRHKPGGQEVRNYFTNYLFIPETKETNVMVEVLEDRRGNTFTLNSLVNVLSFKMNGKTNIEFNGQVFEFNIPQNQITMQMLSNRFQTPIRRREASKAERIASFTVIIINACNAVAK